MITCLLLYAMGAMAQWSGVRTVWFYANAYFPHVSTQVIDADTSGNIYLAWYGNTFEFEFDIVQYKFNGISWSGWQRVDDALTGAGYYGLSRMASISVEPDGKRMIAWEDMKTGYFEIHTKYYNNADIPSQEMITNDSAKTWYPKLQYAGSRHHIFYIDNKSGYFNIYSNYYDSLWHNETQVVSESADCHDFDYHMYSDLSGVLVYLKRNSNYDNIYAKTMNSGVWGSQSGVFTGNFDCFYPNVISDNSNTFLLFTANINGITQLFLSRYNGGSWSYPRIISDNNSNIIHPEGVISGNNLHIMYVSDRYPDGEIIYSVYDIVADSIISTETAIGQRNGPIYTPKAVIDANGNLQMLFICSDGEVAPGRGPSNIYHITRTGIKDAAKSALKPYTMEYSGSHILLSSSGNDAYTVTVIDKTGRIIGNTSGAGVLLLDKGDFVRNDIYFLNIRIGEQVFTEKVVWIR